LIYSVDNIVKYDTSVHTLTSATHHIESISAGILCEETSQEETNKQTNMKMNMNRLNSRNDLVVMITAQ